jgi:outer membrane protein OmpA-like peptidoglycan-associated protein
MHQLQAIPTLVTSALLVVAMGCQHRGGGETELRPAEPRTAANAQVEVGDEHRYDANVLARTGIAIDQEIMNACQVVGAPTVFAFDSTKISSPTHETLAAVASCVTDGALRGRELELVGHTDPRGTDAYNQELGLSRAESVAGCLREHGVEATKIEINSVGENTASSDASDWPLDRRVEIRVKSVAAAAR